MLYQFLRSYYLISFLKWSVYGSLNRSHTLYYMCIGLFVRGYLQFILNVLFESPISLRRFYFVPKIIHIKLLSVNRFFFTREVFYLSIDSSYYARFLLKDVFCKSYFCKMKRFCERSNVNCVYPPIHFSLIFLSVGRAHSYDERALYKYHTFIIVSA